jgi:hypothetical protein
MTCEYLFGGFLLQRDCPEAHGLVFAESSHSGELYGCEPTPCSPRSHILSTGFTSGMPCRRFKERRHSSGALRVPARGTPAPPALSIPALNGGAFRARRVKEYLKSFRKLQQQDLISRD